LRAAVGAQSRLAAMKADGCVRAAEIDFGIGVHFGDVVFGNAGTAERLKFGVIGRAVNEVARNQDMSKLLGQPIVVSDTVADRARTGQSYRLQSLGMHDLRGMPTARRLWALRA
jgi:adenylate cyclase